MRPIFDAHLDLAWSALFWNRDLTATLADVRDAESNMQDHPARGRGTVTLPEMRRARVAVCLGTVLVRSKPHVCPAGGFNRRDLDYRNQTLAGAIGQAHLAYYRLLEGQGHVRILRTLNDLLEHWHLWQTDPGATTLGVILAMEGADPIVTPAQANWWWDQGLRCVGLAHYGQGPYAVGTGSEGSLTAAGFELLEEFQRLGMIVDLTHTAEPGFMQVLDSYDGAVLASHGTCRALVPGDRQFSDGQIRRLIERDSVIGMALDAWMLQPRWVIGRSQPQSLSISAVADHIDHICQMSGNARHVGIGSDLDGGFGTEQTPHDLDSINDLHKLESILGARGYSAGDIDAFFFGNWLRFLSGSLPTER